MSNLRPTAPFLGLCLALLSLPLAGQSPIGSIVSGQSRTGFTAEGAGARALGMGGAFIAVADDATAATFNPAGLAQILRPEISFVGQAIERRVSYQEFRTPVGGQRLAVTDSLIGHRHFDPLLLSAMVPVAVDGRNLAIQLSIQRAFTLGEGDTRHMAEAPMAGTGAAASLDQSLHQSGQIDVYSLALAYECSQRILLGLTCNLWRGRWDLDTQYQETSGGVGSSLHFSQSNRLDGQNYTFGLLWRWPTWTLGLVHSTAFRADYSFQTSLDTLLPVNSGRVPSGASVGLHCPDTTGLGLAVRPAESWLVTADLQYTPWSEARFMTSQASLNGVGFFDLRKGGHGQNATSFRVGLEKVWVTASNLLVPLRLGACREPQPLVDPVTGQQRIMYGLTLGSGLKTRNLRLDVAYRYAWARRQASQFLDVNQILNGKSRSSVGTERTVEQRLEVTLGMQFDRAPVDRALHKLFVGD